MPPGHATDLSVRDKAQWAAYYVELLKEPGRREVVRMWASNKAQARLVGEQLVKDRGYWKVGRVLRTQAARRELPKWWSYLRTTRDVIYARDELGL